MALAVTLSILRAMKPINSQLVYVLAGLLTGASMRIALADTKPNPYEAIIDRNPFGLKPPPPIVEPTNTVAPVSPGKVILTGIASLFGPAPRALLEITEQETGKQATTRKPILREGERDGAVEVLSIDMEKGVVKIRNAGVESTIAFETPKLTGGGGSAPAPGGASPAPLSASVPNIISSANAAAATSARSSSVTIIGGSSSGTTASSFGSGSGTYPQAGGPGGVGGYSTGPAAFSAASYNPAAIAANGGLSPIPSRALRTDPANPPVVPVDPVAQYIHMAADHERHVSAGLIYPPLPPVPQ